MLVGTKVYIEPEAGGAWAQFIEIAVQMNRVIGRFQDMTDKEVRELYLRGDVVRRPDHIAADLADACITDDFVWVLLKADSEYGSKPIDQMLPHPIYTREIRIINQD